MTNKIGILCTYSFPEGMAPTIRILSYGQGLVDNGCKVEVVIFQPRVDNTASPLEGYACGVKYTYAHQRDNSKSTLYKLFVDRPKSLINAIKIIRASNKNEKFDCFLLSFDHPTYLLFFAPILRMMGIKIGFIGDEFPEPIRRLKSTIPLYYKIIYKFVYLFISFRVLMTEALQKFYDEMICKKPTHILCSILNINRFDGIKKQNVTRKYMCYMGNMMLTKDNVDNIIRAFKRICNDFPNIDLYLYGTPSDRDKKVVEGVISELGLNKRVFIKGRIDYSLVPQTLANAEVLVTSQPFTKRAAGGFPTKLAEYMMSKTPTIVTNVGEIHCYVHDGGTVFMVEPCDDVAYAKKMRYILTHSKEANEVAERAYEYAKNHFGSKEVTKKLICFLNKTLTNE